MFPLYKYCYCGGRQNVLSPTAKTDSITPARKWERTLRILVIRILFSDMREGRCIHNLVVSEARTHELSRKSPVPEVEGEGGDGEVFICSATPG